MADYSDMVRRIMEFAEAKRQDPGIVTKMILGLQDAAKLPGDVYQGKREATPEAGMEFGMNFAGAGSMVPKPTNSLGIFGGKMAKTADQTKLRVAEFYERQGFPPDRIWEETGWARGKDGKWRFEIDDSKAHLWSEASNALAKGETLNPLRPSGGGFSHPELYEAYPELKTTILAPEPRGSNNNGAYWGRGPEGKPHITLKSQFRPKMQSTLLHEIQHVVQDIEGFAKGGNPGQFQYRLPGGSGKKIDKINGVLLKIRQREAALYPKHAKGDKSLEPELMALGQATEKLIQMRQKVAERMQSPYDQYKALAGETEARNVQTRAPHGPENNSQIPPWATEDVPRSKQVVW
jgi:hypothetical protein